jgi:hypothetical protein
VFRDFSRYSSVVKLAPGRFHRSSPVRLVRWIRAQPQPSDTHRNERLERTVRLGWFLIGKRGVTNVVEVIFTIFADGRVFSNISLKR